MKKIELDDEQVYKLASIGCTYEEISFFFGCSVDVLRRKYQDVIQSGLSSAKMSIRRERMRIALDPLHKSNAVMLMFLSKTMLGEREYNVVDARTIGLPSEIELSDAQPPSNED